VDNIVIPKLALNRRTLPFQTDFLIAGTQCRLSTNSQELLQAAAAFHRAALSQNGAPSFEMEIIVDSALDRAPERLAYFRGMGHIVFAILPPRSFIAYDLLRKRVHAVLSDAAARDHSFWKTLFLPITIGVLGATIGVAPIHCACLERSCKGFLVAGVSGAGKSTLTAALAQRGFPLISDDWTYISKQQCTLVAHGLFSPLKLLPDAARFFPDLRAFVPRMALNGEMAYEIDPPGSLGFTTKNISYPRQIFFLERTTAPGCYLVPCRPEYVREFFEKNAERLPEELAEAKAFRSRIIQELSACPARILRTGESPQVTAKVLDDFLVEADRATA
jgi:hypothetical protein